MTSWRFSSLQFLLVFLCSIDHSEGRGCGNIFSSFEKSSAFVYKHLPKSLKLINLERPNNTQNITVVLQHTLVRMLSELPPNNTFARLILQGCFNWPETPLEGSPSEIKSLSVTEIVTVPDFMCMIAKKKGFNTTGCRSDNIYQCTKSASITNPPSTTQLPTTVQTTAQTTAQTTQTEGQTTMETMPPSTDRQSATPIYDALLPISFCLNVFLVLCCMFLLYRRRQVPLPTMELPVAPAVETTHLVECNHSNGDVPHRRDARGDDSAV